MADKHIANRETQWVALNVNPDFCKVGKTVIPFDIARTLNQDKALYAKTVYARGEPVLMIDSVACGVKGNAGRGVKSKVARNKGHVWIRAGSTTVFVEGRALVRHLDPCRMNVEIDGIPLDAQIGEAKP
jgi:hypothetical protein